MDCTRPGAGVRGIVLVVLYGEIGLELHQLDVDGVD